jgi:hypothetical protein
LISWKTKKTQQYFINSSPRKIANGVYFPLKLISSS